MARPAAPRSDTSIETYRSKRDFTATREPAPPDTKPGANTVITKHPGAKSPVAQETTAPIFVVQKHQAQRAGQHWDFRLEHNDVLWSWAVPKGPSLDPTDKRIAVHVEDHPLDYADFHGNIPEGSYGAGSVETWDRGTWEPLLDPDQGLQDGEIKFVLSGNRLNGKFTLVRLKPKPKQRGRQDNWLLIKGHDAHERQGADAAMLEATIALPTRGPKDARDAGDAANAPPPVPPKIAQKLSRKPRSPSASATPVASPAADTPPNHKNPRDASAPGAPARTPSVPGATQGELPEKQTPQLASVADAPPDDDDWLTEIKFDGYRLLAFLDHGKVTILTRNGKDWTSRLPAVAKAISQMQVSTALVDGELVALDKQGVSSFPSLQAALSNGQDHTLVFYLFDLLHLDGWDLRHCALRDRKKRLADLDIWRGMLRYSDHHEGDTIRMRKAACQMKLEGIICKRANAPYRPGRGHDWLKLKCQGREEFIILGWTEPAGSRTGLGALHLGYYDHTRQLHYAGGVGTGFSDDTLELLRDRLDALSSKPPLGLMIAGEDLERTIHWVQPKLIAETSFTAWSGAGRVRHAVFLGLRDDKAPTEVIRDPADPDAERRLIDTRAYAARTKRKAPVIAVPPVSEPDKQASRRQPTHQAPPSQPASKSHAAPTSHTAQSTSARRSAKTAPRHPSAPTAPARQSTPNAPSRQSTPSAPSHRSDQSTARRKPAQSDIKPEAPQPPREGNPAPGATDQEPNKAKTAREPAKRISGSIVTARAPRLRTETIEGVNLTHPDRALWPGITKRDLVTYWQTVASHALPGIAHRPLAIVRCPEGVDGEHFFQKHGYGGMPPGIREATADKAPYLLIDDLQGLVAMAQMSAIELHVWGATQADPLHPDQLVFDLDPGEGVKLPEITAAALDLRDGLEAINLASFCRTSGGKGLHVVAPLVPGPSWDTVRAFCKSFAESASQANPDKYLAHVKIADRRGRILIDWLRNGLGSTAVASFCPRARPGAGVATPLFWKEVTPKLDVTAFTLKTVPTRLAKLRADPWAEFDQSRRPLPAVPKQDPAAKAAPRPTGKVTIVTAKPPKLRTRGS